MKFRLLFLLSLVQATYSFYPFKLKKTYESSLYNFDRQTIKNSEELLEIWKKMIHEHRSDVIVRLEQSENPDDQCAAETLKKRTDLDHICIRYQGKKIYVQLCNSFLPGGPLGRPLFGRNYKIDTKKNKQIIEELFNQLPQQHKAKFAIYPSEKKHNATTLQKLKITKKSDNLFSATLFIED